MCSLTRPLVAFSTCCPQTASTSLVSRWLGDTQLDMVRVVVCAAAGHDVSARAAPERTAAPTRAVPERRGIVRQGIVDILPNLGFPPIGHLRAVIVKAYLRGPLAAVRVTPAAKLLARPSYSRGQLAAPAWVMAPSRAGPTRLAYFSSTPARRSGWCGTWAARRAAISAAGISTSIEPAVQSMRTTSPSRTSAIGPPAAASGPTGPILQ